MRLRIAVYKKYKVLHPFALSWRAAFQCSPYTEGCGGGFGYLTFKFFQEAGVPAVDPFDNRFCDVEVWKRSYLVEHYDELLKKAKARAAAAAASSEKSSSSGKSEGGSDSSSSEEGKKAKKKIDSAKFATDTNSNNAAAKAK